MTLILKMSFHTLYFIIKTSLKNLLKGRKRRKNDKKERKLKEKDKKNVKDS